MTSVFGPPPASLSPDWPGPNWYAALAAARDRRRDAQRDFEHIEEDHDDAARDVETAIQAALVAIDAARDLGSWNVGTSAAGPPADDLIFVRTDDGLMLVDADTAEAVLAVLRREGRFEQFVTGERGSSATDMARRLDVARALGLAPRDYANLLRTHHEQRALDEAGIAWSDWEDLSVGARELQPVVVKVYDYYGQMFLDHPELEWAGLANLVGPAFAAGFLDLGLAEKEVSEITDAGDSLVEFLWDQSGMPPTFRNRPDLPPGVSEAPLRAVINLPADEIRFYEQTFLSMQRKIFLDMAAMHQTYIDGGLPAIEEMHLAGLLDRGGNSLAADDTLTAWRDIHHGSLAGDSARLHRAAKALALREQQDIIQSDYEVMDSRVPGGHSVTTVMSWVGQISVPETQTMREWKPTKNVADFNDRWAYFVDDTLPAYIRLLEDEDRQRLPGIINSDMSDRINDFRAHHRIDNLLLTTTPGPDQ